MSAREFRRFIRGWWADQMRNPTAPDLPDDCPEDAFEIWEDESRKLADRLMKRSPA